MYTFLSIAISISTKMQTSKEYRDQYFDDEQISNVNEEVEYTLVKQPFPLLNKAMECVYSIQWTDGLWDSSGRFSLPDEIYSFY